MQLLHFCLESLMTGSFPLVFVLTVWKEVVHGGFPAWLPHPHRHVQWRLQMGTLWHPPCSPHVNEITHMRVHAHTHTSSICTWEESCTWEEHEDRKTKGLYSCCNDSLEVAVFHDSCMRSFKILVPCIKVAILVLLVFAYFLMFIE